MEQRVWAVWSPSHTETCLAFCKWSEILGLEFKQKIKMSFFYFLRALDLKMKIWKYKNVKQKYVSNKCFVLLFFISLYFYFLICIYT